jgi:hypothetical protein
MKWLDDLIDGANAAKAEPTPEPIAPAPPKVCTVWIQTRAPSGGDLGGCEAGYYSVANGVLTMCDEEGKPTGQTHKLAKGEDPKVVAFRLRRRAWLKEQGASSDFNRPLGYARSGVA